MQKPRFIQPPQVTGWQPLPWRGLLTQVAQGMRAGHLDFTVGRHAQARMRQWAARRSRTVGAGQIQRLHRAGFGQAIAFVGGQPVRAGGGQQLRAYRRAAHRHQAKLRRGAAACRPQPAGIRAQHLRQDDDALRLGIDKRRMKNGGIKAG
ncbi:hypothetical protein D3C87_1504370 [compost metagenome]